MLLLDISAPATLEGVSTLRRAVRRSLSELRLPAETIDGLQLVVSETGSNVVRHGRPKATTLKLVARLERHLIRLELEDDGGPFEGFHGRLASADTAQNAARDSGMGLDFVRDTVDGLQYRAGTPNQLVLIRRIHSRRPRVLLIEDDRILRDVYRRMLAVHFEPALAGSIAEARSLMAEGAPDVIVSDFHLEDGKGNEVVELLGTTERELPVPLVILTADRRPTLQSMLLRDGVDTILNKPVASRDLLAAVRGALARAARQQAIALSGLGEAFGKLTLDLDSSIIEGWRVGVAHSPAGLGGGDMAFVLAGDACARLVVADVMGHGLQARTSAIGLAGALRALNIGAQAEPSALLRRLNAAMAVDSALGRIFATVQVLDLDRSGHARIASAGHPEPWIIDELGNLKCVSVEGAVPGLLPAASYDVADISLRKGQRLLLMTDGVAPADMSGAGTLPVWLADAARRSHALDVDAAAVLVGEAAKAASPLEQMDDWTILVVEKSVGQPAER